MATPAGGEPAPAGPDAAQAGVASLPSPLDSVDDMRSTAKWTLAAAGAVGAALISGGPLVAVGQVHGFLHAFLAWLGLVIALCGVGVAVWFTGQVLVPRLTTPSLVRDSPVLAGLREQIAAEPAEFMGFSATTVDGLFRRHGRLREKTVELMLKVSQAKDAKQRATLQAELAQVQKNREVVDVYVRWVLALGHAWLVRADLERSRVWTLVGGIVVAFGAVLFFSVTGSTTSPSPTPAHTATAVPAATASAVVRTPASATRTP
jgi:hypothetical protein